MGLYDFISLDKEGKANMLWQLGVFLMARPYSAGTINLYGIDDFYVEVYYNQELNCIEDIRSFRSVGCLEDYLDKMNLTDLFL